MTGWYASAQARDAVRMARTLARERRHAVLGTNHLLAAILRQWDDEHAGGPALLRACGLTGEQASGLADALLQDQRQPDAPAPEPRPNPALRFAFPQALRIAVEARDEYVGTEHLVVALLWQDDAHALRRLGISYALAAERLRGLPRTERAVGADAIEPLAARAAPTPAAARLAELARQQAEQYPVDGRVSSIHYLLALLIEGGAGKLLGELGVSSRRVVELLTQEGQRLVALDDQRRELPPEGWAQFRVTRQEWETIHGRMAAVLLDEGGWQQGVRFGFNYEGEMVRVMIHPGRSGLDPDELLNRLLRQA